MPSQSDSDYRVKFVDIRAGGKKRRAKTREPVAPDAKTCDKDGCEEKGTFKAPKSRNNPDDVFWFCQKHAGEYNRKWNYFEDMSDDEMAAFNEASRNGFRETWTFGKGPVGGNKAAKLHDRRRWAGREFLDDGDDAPRSARRRKDKRVTNLQQKALDELNLPANATAQEIKDRYSELVKLLHPDSNGGDRSTEPKLAKVIRAFKTLKKDGLVS